MLTSKYIDMKNEIDIEKLKEVATSIQKGKIVVFPTETVYGIGTNGLDEKAVKKLYEIKQRPQDKAISLLVSDIKMVEQVARNITELEYRLMEEFFPGPLTLILNKKENVTDIVTAGKDTVGVRMPSGEIARKLIEYAKTPIAAPSANISGEPSGTNLENIIKSFDGKVEYFIDSGESELGIASTIVQVIDGVLHILREGNITKEQIEKVAKLVRKGC